MEHFADPVRLSIKNDIPGPGIYGFGVELNKRGVYALSNNENSKAATWSPLKKDRTEEASYTKHENPGPGMYNPSDYSDGLYILSKFKNKGTHQYRTKVGKKMLTVKKDTPGPGSYIAPSDFGHLDLNRAYLNPDERNQINSTIQKPSTPRSSKFTDLGSTRRATQLRTQSQARSRNPNKSIISIRDYDSELSKL